MSFCTDTVGLNPGFEGKTGHVGLSSHSPKDQAPQVEPQHTTNSDQEPLPDGLIPPSAPDFVVSPFSNCFPNLSGRMDGRMSAVGSLQQPLHFPDFSCSKEVAFFYKLLYTILYTLYHNTTYKQVVFFSGIHLHS